MPGPFLLSCTDLALLESRARPFSRPGWIFELKYDGYRCLAVNAGGTVQMISKRGRDMSRAFPELVAELSKLPEDTAVDGELVLLDGRGHPQFEGLLGRSAVTRPEAIARASRERPATLVCWDLLMLAGEDLRWLPLLKRKTALKRALRGMDRVTFASHVASEGESLYAQAVAHELEGIVAKRADSRYKAGRTADWIKIKTPVGKAREGNRMEHLRR
jgi:ATP-dependent DNA ligase